VQCTFTVAKPFKELEENINITLYRIVQECLTNIAKYSKATLVTIYLQVDSTEEILTLEVVDNGQGMHPVQHKRGLGLIGMRERVEALLGKMYLETAPGHGVKIAVKIPIAEEYQQKYKSWK
jgi:two-component system sensor histidine kinase UhpB